MDSEKLKKEIFLRCAGLIATTLLFSYFIFGNVSGGGFSILILLVLLGFQIHKFTELVILSRKEIGTFIDSLDKEDFDAAAPKTSSNEKDPWHGEFRKVMNKFHRLRAENEAQHQYLKNIVQHIGIGIITFDKKGKIQILNTAAKQLIGIKQAMDIQELELVNPKLYAALLTLKTGGRELITFQQEGEIIQLAIEALELSLQDREFKLVSLQNIQSELEEKEMEAWQNLTKVLTHEIMNSVTPISSLASTTLDELAVLNKGFEEGNASEESLEDISMAVETIRRRSKGLIKFVSDFRNLTRTPKPQPKVHAVKDCVQNILRLLRNEMQENKVTCHLEVKPEDMQILMDKDLIEQVLINLVKNSIQALSENEELDKDRIIWIKAYPDEKGHSYISVKDNGSGIEEEALSKIFIPFFTTKKNGSGIGLSLSKQIMREHKGSIQVRSQINEGTEFILKF